MSLTVANLRDALQRKPPMHRAVQRGICSPNEARGVAPRETYWTPPRPIIWRSPSELFGSAVLYGIAVTALLMLATG